GFVAKLNAAGSALVYSTYLGGSNEDRCYGVGVDPAGTAYMRGFTASSNFRVTSGAFQTAFVGQQDAFVTKLTSAGALAYSTYLSGPLSSNGFTYVDGFGIAVDGSGYAYVTGEAGSDRFPVTAGAAQTTYGGVYDAFVTKLNTTGTGLVYSTYLGGSNQDPGWAMAVDGAGNAYVTGVTPSSNFPTANALQGVLKGGQDAFVARLNAAGSAFLYSTYLGGGSGDSGRGIAVDSAGTAYVTGSTSS